MQLIEAIYVLLSLCIILLILSVLYLDQKKIVSAFLVFTISISFFLIPGLFSFLGMFFLILFLFSNNKENKIDHLVFSFIFFAIGSIEFMKNYSLEKLVSLFLVILFLIFIIFLFFKKIRS